MVAGYNEGPFKYVHITTATTTTIKSNPGFLYVISINNPGTSNTITINDGAAVIGVISPSTSVAPVTMFYEVGFNTSLSIVTSAACDLTIVYV